MVQRHEIVKFFDDVFEFDKSIHQCFLPFTIPA